MGFNIVNDVANFKKQAQGTFNVYIHKQLRINDSILSMRKEYSYTFYSLLYLVVWQVSSSSISRDSSCCRISILSEPDMFDVSIKTPGYNYSTKLPQVSYLSFAPPEVMFIFLTICILESRHQKRAE